MSDRQPYSRVYWTFLHDDKYRNARALIEQRHRPRDWAREVAAFRGTWLMLLVQHDQAYPAPGILPASLYQPALKLLTEVGFVRLLGGEAYELAGLEAERNRRADAARRGPKGDEDAPPPKPKAVPNGTQLGPKREAVEAQAKPSLDEDKTSLDAPTRAPDPADVYWNLTGKYPQGASLTWIDELALSFGPDSLIRALAKAHGQDRSTNTLLGRTRDVLNAEARAISRKEQENVRAQLKERRSAPREDIDQEALTAEIRRLMEVAA